MTINGETATAKESFKDEEEDIPRAPYGSIVNQELNRRVYETQRREEVK